MRLANIAGSAVVMTTAGPLDLHQASDGRFGPSMSAIYESWRDVVAWVGELDTELAGDGDWESLVEAKTLEAPSPHPRQVFAIGLNYHDHAAETGTPVPQTPPVFTKFQTSIDGPRQEVALSGDRVDWEVELVVVIGVEARDVAEGDAWSYVAGVTVGQDFSDRAVQLAGPVPQFSLGKSFPGYSPMGPVLVTLDEIEDPDDLALRCTVNDEVVQDGRTSQMVFAVPQLIAYLSSVTKLLPGDVIFTGTPSGVGVARSPQRFLAAGDEVVSRIEGIGAIHSRCS